MNYSIFRFTLNMHSLRSQTSIPVKWGDTGVRLYITITDGGAPYIFEKGCKAVLRARKADDTVLVNYCRIENESVVVYDFTEQTSSCPGIVECQIDLIGSDGKSIGSPNFVIMVDANVVYNHELIESNSERDVLADLVSAKDSAQASAEEAVHSANSAYESSESAKASAEQASSNALASRQNMDTAISKAEEARNSAELAEDAVQDARNYADEASQTATDIKAYADAVIGGRVTDIELDYDNQAHIIQISLKGTLADGTEGVIGTVKEFDLPLESVVVGGEYDAPNRAVVLTLQNGNEVRFSVVDLVSGLVSQDAFNECWDKVRVLQSDLGSKSSVRVNGKIVNEFDADSKVNQEDFKSYKNIVNNAYDYLESEVYKKAYKEYVDDIAEKHDRRLEDLESTLLTYVEDTTQAYEKVVPNAVAPNAILDSIGGESVASKNLYNPKGNFGVNADGSIRIREQANMSGPTTVEIPLITLNAGTYYIKYNAVGNATIDTFFLSDDNGDNLNPSTLIVDKTTTYYARVDFDATSSETGGCEVDLYVMISKTDIPFEPYFEGLHHAFVTKVISKDKQGNVIDTYAIPDGIKSLTDYGKKYTYVDFDNKQFVNNSYTIVLTGNEPMHNAYQYGENIGLCIGNSNQYPYGPSGSGATNTPYVSNEITVAWVARYGQLWWLNAYSGYGLNKDWANAYPNAEEEAIAKAKLREYLAKRYADGNPVVLTYQVGEGTTTDISQYLTDYDKYKLIKAQAGGTIVFENEHKVAPNSTITYVKAKE